MFDISDDDEITILITDGWRTWWYIPKFRYTVEVDEPYITIHWTDTEVGSSGIRRSTPAIDFNDITFGYATPSSAGEVATTLLNFRNSAFGGTGGGEDLAATLAIGNETGGTDLIIETGDFLVVDDATPSTFAGFSASNELESVDAKTINGNSIFGSGNLNIKNYWIPLCSLSGTITSSATRYFGNVVRAVAATATESKIYFREAGTITQANVIFFANGTIGSNENISIYVRLNNTTDYLVATVGAATIERLFLNTGMTVPIASGDYVEMKIVSPAWATPPTAVLLSGNLIFVAS